MAAAGEVDGQLDELAEGADPMDCPACVEAGDACSFHEGFGAGWDAAVAFMAAAVQGEAAEAVAWLSPGADVDELDGLDERRGLVR